MHRAAATSAPEDARHVAEHVDARPPELLQRHELKPCNPPRPLLHRPRTNEPRRERHALPLGLDGVEAPEVHGDGLWVRAAVGGAVRREDGGAGGVAAGLGRGAGHAVRVERVDVAPCKLPEFWGEEGGYCCRRQLAAIALRHNTELPRLAEDQRGSAQRGSSGELQCKGNDRRKENGEGKDQHTNAWHLVRATTVHSETMQQAPRVQCASIHISSVAVSCIFVSPGWLSAASCLCSRGKDSCKARLQLQGKC